MQVMFSTAVSAAHTRWDAAYAVRRKLAAVSPLVAAALLTAAVFLLPAPDGRHQAYPLAGQVKASTVLAAFK